MQVVRSEPEAQVLAKHGNTRLFKHIIVTRYLLFSALVKNAIP